ncbi:MAG: DUF4249 domain-containing protein [Prevotella micans]|nr:DUF4249 domain-containing protein [Prevotella micans]
MKQFKPGILIALIAILGVILTSCKNEIDLDRKYLKRTLALNGYINVDSAENVLSVSWTDELQPILITDATMKITVNGQLRQTLTGSNDISKVYRINTPFAPGDRVRIDVVTADGSGHAYVEETVPLPIEKIDELKVEEVKQVSYYDNRGEKAKSDMYKISVRFRDNPQTDFYRLTTTIFQTRRNSSLNTLEYFKPISFQGFIATGDPVMMEGKPITQSSDEAMNAANGGSVVNRYAVFNDLMMGGRDCNISFYISPNEFIPEFRIDLYNLSADLRVTVCSFSEAAYYYLKSLNLRESEYYDDYKDLTGPIKLPSNVRGGTGIVGFYTSRSLPVKLFGSDRYPGLYN